MTLHQTEMEGSDPASFEVFSSTEGRAGHHALTWCLYGAGILLILFAHSLGGTLQPKIPMGNDVFMSNPEDARAIETNMRIVGGLLFAAGLVERVVLVVVTLKQKPRA